tara:strand:- start:1159 stop:1584 length:426 start_codon:yes stop_codon:yes gene_type:complete
MRGKELGDLGEMMVYAHLKKEGFPNVFPVQNSRNNGVDLIAESADGTIHIFEIKTTAKEIGNLKLTKSQADLKEFADQRLGWAANKVPEKGYPNISDEAAANADRILDKIRDGVTVIHYQAVQVEKALDLKSILRFYELVE